MMTRSAGFRTAALMSCFLALAACSKKKPDLDAGLGADGGGGSGLDAGAGGVSPGSQADFQTNVGDRVYFPVDQTDLTSEGREILTRQSEWLQQYPDVIIQVEGHADERGTRDYNLGLSKKRATSMRNYLVSQGVKGNRVSSVAFGKEKPAQLCDAEECWSQNRRAVTVITGGAN
jgi:peptidoglycan-associated lipoprotein